MKTKLYALAFLLASLPFAGKAQISLTNASPTATQNFDAMGSTLNLPTNWRVNANGAAANYRTGSTAVTQQASSGSPTAGGTYNFGSSTSERAVGAMTSGSYASPNNYIAYFQNGGTTAITGLSVSYNGERYRINTAAASIQFFYSLDSTTWNAVTAGDIATTSFATGSNSYTFGTPLSVSKSGIAISSLNIPASGIFYLRWNLNTTGSNSQGIAIDDISVTATFATGCTGPTTAATSYSTTNLATTSATLGWTSGNGTNRVAFLKAGSFTSAVPSTNTTYTASSDFTSATSTAFDGGKTVYNSSSNSIGVTNLTPNTLYNAKVFEYLGAAGAECYLSTALSGSFTTLSNAATTTAATALSASGFTANWTAPSGNGAATFTYTLEVATDTGFTSIVSTTNSIASGTTSQAVAGLSAFTTYYYRVRAVNAGGSSANSNRTSVTTYAAAPPTPTAAANPACVSTTLNAYTGGQSSTYYWQGTNASGTSFSNPATATYPVTATGTYYVRAYDNINMLWSAASSLLVTVYNAPTITTQPSPANVSAGSTATFTVTATDAGSYQWQADTTGGGFVNLPNGGAYSGATSATLSIANTTIAMSGYRFRVVVGATSPCTGSVTSSPADTLTVSRASAATDYFRSRVTSGAYSSTGTWESSADSITWGNASSVPTNAARSVTIKSTDSVAVTAAGTAAHLYLYGKMTFTGNNVLTVADSSGYDMVLFNGSTLTGGTAAGGFITLGSGATAFARTGSRIVNSINANLQASAVSTSYFWETGAVAEFSGILSFSTSNIIYFPTADVNTTPIFLVSASVNLNVGATANTTVNGLFQIGSGGSVTWGNAGSKIFRDGILNNGTFTANGSSGSIAISGTTATLGGTGTFSLANATGIVINTGAVATLTSNITVNTSATSTLTVNGTLNTNNFVVSGSTRFATAAASTLSVTDASGVAATATTGNIQTTGTRTYNTAATYTYQGTAAQTSGDGLPTTVAGLTINNATGGLTLDRATTVTTLLTLTNGNITTTSTNLLTLASGASVSGASALSYIDGPLRRNTAAATAFAFPIGKNGVYAPAAVTPVDVTPSNYTAEHFNGTEVSPGRSDKDTPTLRYVSANAYYDISRGAGVNATVTLSYNEANQVTDLSSLVVAHYTGGRWISEGGTASGTTTSGTVTSNIVSTFSPFAIGSGSASQPLPIRLLSFEGRKEGSAARLNWTLGTTDGGESIVVERSADGKTFSSIHRKEVAQNAHLSQSFIDPKPLTGANYYRLRIIGINGEESFSRTLLVSFGGTAVEGIKTYPNPARDVLTLEWTNTEMPALVTLHNSAGQLVWTERVVSGNVLSVPVEKLTPGVYWITLEQNGNVERKKVVVGR